MSWLDRRLPLLALLAMGSLCAHSQADDAKKTNMVFLLCDDLGYGDLGCFGHKVIQTPHLDRLASEGIKLTQCYASSPVCSPSRAGIITGRNPNRLGIRDWIPLNSSIYLKTDEPSVAKLVKSAGYATAHVGKWHLLSKFDGSEPTPGDHGFDHWFSTQNNAAPSHKDPINFVRNGEPVGPLNGYSSEIIVDEAIRWLGTTGDKPFCLFVWFHAPHEPVATPKEFESKYPTPDDPTKAVYYGAVTEMDAAVGKLMASLDDKGLRENTFVMFTSDNGPETLLRYKTAKFSHGSPGDLRGMKLHMTEGGYRVPGIIRWPGHAKAGEVCHEPVNGTDVLPTLCQIAGAPLPADVAFDGASMLPIFDGKPIERKVPLYWQYDRAIGGPSRISLLIDKDWKLLADAKQESFELYNLGDDPGETKNLAGEYPERVAELAAKMKTLHREINETK